MDYFRLQEWEEEWIDMAENLVHEEYIDAYENRTTCDAKAGADDEVGVILFTAFT